jgi:hypothetical protein
MACFLLKDVFGKEERVVPHESERRRKGACAISGELISPEQAHADHAPPRTFGTLAITFLEVRGITSDASFVTPPADDQYQPTLSDRRFAAERRAYHHRLAAIRVVAKGATT